MARSARHKNVELPVELHDLLRQEAKKQGLTIATAALISVREWLERQEVKYGRKVSGGA